ncbi:restriction endonuclease subunit S [Streptomyces sp. NPDC090073]|uniref:restriction endonuclease subunit S n=1 Tax=Streptomyces sp. NPDC090073 TaxID=3365936 RepID=UPI0038072247
MSNDLPRGWTEVRLKDLLTEDLVNGRSVPTRHDGFPVLRLTALRSGIVDPSESKGGAWTEEEAAPFLVQPGDLLVSRGNGSRALVGRGALVSDMTPPVAFPDTMIRIRIDNQLMDLKFLRLVWESRVVRRQIEAAARTTAGIYKINQRILGGITLPLPPVNEQHRIVTTAENHLTRIDAGVAGVREVIRRARSLRDTITERGSLGYFTSSQRGPKVLAPASAHDGTLPDLPEGWSWARLDELANVVGGVTKDSKKQWDPAYVEVPYLRVANVQRGRLDLAEIMTIRVPEKKAENLRLQPGDVLLNEGGDRDKLGRGWVWEGQIDKCIHQNHVFRARVRDGVIHPKLLAWHANGFGKSWCDRNGKQSVNLASISLTKIKLLPVAIPPQPEQEGIVEFIETQTAVFDAMIASAEKSLARAGHLRELVLWHAVTGKLADQDEADEHASLTLQQVRAARDLGTPKPQRRKPARPRSTTASSAPSAIQESLL